MWPSKCGGHAVTSFAQHSSERVPTTLAMAVCLAASVPQCWSLPSTSILKASGIPPQSWLGGGLDYVGALLRALWPLQPE